MLPEELRTTFPHAAPVEGPLLSRLPGNTASAARPFYSMMLYALWGCTAPHTELHK